jgi:hypothetical protein
VTHWKSLPRVLIVSVYSNNLPFASSFWFLCIGYISDAHYI